MNSFRYSEDPRLRTAQRVVFWTVIGLVGITAFGLLFGAIIQGLWNATLADMFGLPAITFWQAVGIFILAKLLFGFGGSGGSSSAGQREKRRKAHTAKSPADAQDAAETAEDASEWPALAEEEAFRRFWREEGRNAYEAYRGRSAEGD